MILSRLIFRVTITAIVTAVVGWYTYALADDPGLDQPVFWIWAWFAWLGWLVVVVDVLQVCLDLGDRYYQAKPFEREGQLYRKCGVRQIKKFTVNGDYWNRLIRSLNPKVKGIHSIDSMKNRLGMTRSKEAGHLIHLVTSLPVLGYTLIQGWLTCTICLLLLDILFDLYPIGIQRYNRFRIQRILEARWVHERRDSTELVV